MTDFAERTIWAGGNLDILRGLNPASVDLICLDPPFNSYQPSSNATSDWTQRQNALAVLLRGMLSDSTVRP